MLNLETLAFDLPEDVLKRKWAGDFEGEIKLIDSLLEKDIPGILKERLLVERRMIPLMQRQFCYTREEAMELMREKIPDFTEEEFDALELDRQIEYIYVLGEKRYLRSFRGTLLKTRADIAERAGSVNTADAERLDAVIAELKAQGTAAYRFHIRGQMDIEDDAFEKDAHFRVHMPVPQMCAQQSEIELHVENAVSVDHDRAHQRTAYYECDLAENKPFFVEYSYVNRIHYVDPLSGNVPEGHVYPNALPPEADDLSEQYPHIVFTPFLKALAAEIKGDETDPVRIAWKFYDYITTKIRYSFMRYYFLMDRHAEFCALNGKGDCGIQAILFITLCRIAGIPARWQSGLCVDPDRCGSHDWAQFYVEPYGWLFADLSYGGSAFRAGSEERRRFYFGNLDPYRMVANSRYQTDFAPAKQCDRWDPYDNQNGEIEMNGRELYSFEFDTNYVPLKIEKLD